MVGREPSSGTNQHRASHINIGGQNDLEILEQNLGKPLRTKDVAKYLGLDIKTVRKYYRDLGGIRLGRHFVFFEKEIVDAISTRKEMDRPSEEGRPATGKGVLDQEGSEGLGSQNAAKTSRRVELEDRHGLFE
jgi:hypothetical protein